MKMQSVLAVMVMGLAMAVVSPVYAEFLDKPAVEKLLKGNTIEGEDFKFDAVVKVYFDPDGIYRRVDDKNNKESGAWNIESDGKFCMKQAKFKNCRDVQPGKKEGFYLLIKDGKKSLRITKVHPGNPFNL